MNGYLIIIVLLFSTNLGLFYGDAYDKFQFKSILISVFLFVIFLISKFFNFDLGNIFNYIFITISVIYFIIFYCYLVKNISLKNSFLLTLTLFYITGFLLSSQIIEFSHFDCLLYSSISLIIIFISFQFSKLLVHAKREYSVIISEYMVLSSLLIFIFGLTYWATKELDYTMFSPFLILTPTYQLIYITIGIVVIMVIGSYLNDNK